MRGKKSDREFVADFITESIQSGIETPDEIVREAKRQIAQIEEEIKAVEAKKVLRSKLLDVILTFEKQAKETSTDAKLLSFFRLDYPLSCKFLCDIIKKQPVEIGEKLQLLGSGDGRDPHMIHSVKQLLECKVLHRIGNQLMRGERFDEYMTFVLREDK